MSNSSSSSSSSSSYDYDLIVIGGGSGGLAAAKEAAKLAGPKAKIGCFDYVLPSPHGTRWGLGGTCVNVGCIPKKLMHYAGTLGALWHDFAHEFGWQTNAFKLLTEHEQQVANNGGVITPEATQQLNAALSAAHIKHDWPTMAHTIQDYIRSLNFSYKTSLRTAGVKYFEGYASFVDAHTVAFKGNTRQNTGSVTFGRAIIATGGRPTYGICPGSELAISSDDLFWRDTSPGKTLVIGAGYIALECASFLHHIGNDVSIMIRGEPLRKMDRQSGLQVVELMERSGMRFLVPSSPLSFTAINKAPVPSDATQQDWKGEKVWKLASSTPTHLHLLHESGATEIIDVAANRSEWKVPNGPVRVQFIRNDTKQVFTEDFETVLLAVGRTANTQHLNLPAAGVEVINSKILVDKNEQTTAPHIFAIGDVATGVPSFIDPATSKPYDRSLLSKYAVERPELTPVAIKAGILLAQRLFAHSASPMRYETIPSTVFTSPSEYAFVGLSEEEARRPVEFGGVGDENVRVYYSRYGTIEISPTHPHPPPQRSHAFTTRTWSHIHADKHHLDWAECTFDPESAASVIYTDPSKGRVNALITDKRRDDSGALVYDITREDNGDTVVGVRSSQLELTPDLAKERAELFEKAQNLAKLVVDKRSDKVLGVHFVGGTAGEVIQGFTLAIKLGAIKKDFDDMVGIHPIAAEEFAVLEVTKESGVTPLKKAGCGGGSCG